MNEKAPVKKRTTSRTYASRFLAIRRTAEAALKNADQLSSIQDLKTRGQELLTLAEDLQKWEDEQEGLKRQLSAVTARLAEGLKNGEAERTKLIKLAEGTLKKGDPILTDFRARS